MMFCKTYTFCRTGNGKDNKVSKDYKGRFGLAQVGLVSRQAWRRQGGIIPPYGFKDWGNCIDETGIKRKMPAAPMHWNQSTVSKNTPNQR